MKSGYRFTLLVYSFLFLCLTFGTPSFAAKKEPGSGKRDDTSEISVLNLNTRDVASAPQHLLNQVSPSSPLGQSLVQEVEPNDTAATAQLISASSLIHANIFPTADSDFFKFTAVAGDVVYTATMTSFSASSTDTVLDLLDQDGTTVLETDDQDGSLGGNASTIAGKVIPGTGTYFIRVRSAGQARPYRLYFRLQSGTPVTEIEPNDTPGTAMLLPVSGWITGTTSSGADLDYYTLSLNAGDTVFASLDADPTRDNTQWDTQLGVAIFGTPPSILVVADATAPSLANPTSEAIFMTVKDAGQYYVRVASNTGTTFGDYGLSVTVIPAAAGTCTTYASTNVPQVIPTGPAIVDSTLTIPGNPRIASVSLTLDLTHALMTDLDVALITPAGNENSVFTDIGSATQPIMLTSIDDDNGIPIGLFTVVQGPGFTPEFNYRLGWLTGEDAGGTWTLRLRDDTAANGGTLNNWSLTVCEPAPDPTCGPGTYQTTVYSSDFETDDGGFTHSGVADEWARGLPTFPPITTCNSGVNCWNTDLANTYNASSSQDLLSPNINLAGMVAPIWVKWAQKYQIESASFDHISVDVRQVGPINPTRLWQWYDATMRDTVGNPTVTLEESAGWASYTRNISAYAGQNIELLYHLDSDTTIQLKGLAIDDVAVYACVSCPVITISPPTLPDGSIGFLYDQLVAGSGGTAPYTFAVTTGTLPSGLTLDTNTGQITGTPTTPGSYDFTITATDANGCTGTQDYTIVITAVCGGGGPQTYSFTGPPVNVPDNTPAGVDIPITVSGFTGTVTDLNFSIDGTSCDADFNNPNVGFRHSFVGDFIVKLTSPLGTSVIMINRPGAGGGFGSQGNNFCQSLFDSESGAPSIQSILNDGTGAPYTATWTTANPLTAFNGEDPNGTWTLNVSDNAGVDTGDVRFWSIIIDGSTGGGIVVDPATLPDGNIGVLYDQTVTGSGGTGPYTFAVTAGSLPTGLTLNPTTGQITGTPTANGTFNFTITATDSLFCTGTRDYTVNITCPTITVSPATLPNGTEGTAYSQTVSGSGGTAPYTFGVSAGSLPTGLTLNPGTGDITGTPTAPGTFNFDITATDANGCTGSQSYTVVIAPLCPTITVNPATLPDGVAGTAYSQTVSGSGGAAPYTFAVTAGTLPTGLTLNGGTGAITGTPTVTGAFNFTITATDNNGCTGSQAYTVNITCPTITVNPATLPDGTTGTAYSQTVSGSGGTAPYTFAVTAGALPTGLTLNSGTGAITGTPTAAGTFNFTITATDSFGCTGSQSYTVNINCPGLTMNPPTLPNGTVGTAYSQTLSVTGGTAPYTFAVTTGVLPGGLTLNPSTGDITGTPTTVESQTFTVTATDANGCTVSQSYTITVDPACLFCDDFEDGVLDPSWSYLKPAWSETGGTLIGTAPTGKAVAVAAPVFGGCASCYMEATISTTGGKVWLLGWYVDKKNTVELIMKADADKWIFKEKVLGKTVAKTKAVGTIDLNTFYRARIAYNGTQFVVSIDGTTLITIPAVSSTHMGTVGFQVKKTVASYGEVIVNP